LERPDGQNPEWLYFDSKLTTYAELSQLNSRGVYFVTIRCRGTSILKRLRERPETDWASAVIDILAARFDHELRSPQRD
jgi:hypothetical protein